MFMSEQEIIDDMCLYVLTEDAKRSFRKITDEKHLIQLHSTLGRWIRNRYLLWDEDNPYTDKNPSSPKHPDQLSMTIITRIWSMLQ
jgi:hypothetical protein